jgi:hypothetical protein
MTTERLKMIILTFKAVTNNKNRETVINNIMDLVKDSYELGKNNYEISHLETLLALEEAKTI